MELHDSRPTLTADSAGAVVMFAADSINAAHDVVFGWILLFFILDQAGTPVDVNDTLHQKI